MGCFLVKCCFMFGHSTTPYDTIALIEAAAERQYKEQGIRTFIVGNRGSFDSYAATAIKHLKQKYDDVSLLLLLAYHPAERPVQLSEAFDGSYYPPLEGVPRQYAIVRANKYMVDAADSIICYVNQIGNTRKLLEQAQKRHMKEGIPIENVAEDS